MNNLHALTTQERSFQNFILSNLGSIKHGEEGLDNFFRPESVNDYRSDVPTENGDISKYICCEINYRNNLINDFNIFTNDNNVQSDFSTFLNGLIADNQILSPRVKRDDVIRYVLFRDLEVMNFHVR